MRKTGPCGRFFFGSNLPFTIPSSWGLPFGCSPRLPPGALRATPTVRAMTLFCCFVVRNINYKKSMR
jgi:hypothetical protein